MGCQWYQQLDHVGVRHKLVCAAAGLASDINVAITEPLLLLLLLLLLQASPAT